MDAGANKGRAARKSGDVPWYRVMPTGHLIAPLLVLGVWFLSVESLESARAELLTLPALQSLGPGGEEFASAAVRNLKMAVGWQYGTAITLLLCAAGVRFYRNRVEDCLETGRMMATGLPGQTFLPNRSRSYLWWKAVSALPLIAAASLFVLVANRTRPLSILALATQPDLQPLARFLDVASAQRDQALFLLLGVGILAQEAFSLLAFLEREAVILPRRAKGKEPETSREVPGEAAQASS